MTITAFPSGGASGGVSSISLALAQTTGNVSISGLVIPAATSGASGLAGVLDATRAGIIDNLAAVASSGSFSDLLNLPVDGSQVVSSGQISGVAMTTATPLTITSITLAAGTWEIWATYTTNPAGTTTQSQNQAVISGTTNILTAISGDVNMNLPFAIAAGLPLSVTIGNTIVSPTASTQYFLVGQTAFAVSTLTAGGLLSARRIV